MLKKIIIIATLSIISMNLIAQSQWAGVVDKFSVPCIRKAPIIDGKFSDKEWNGAFEVNGFFVRYPLALAPRAGRCLVGYDNKNLYLAVLSELPPDGKPVSTVRRRDGKVFYDDNIEIWFDPNRSTRDKNNKNDNFYQIIVNSLGTICDIKHSPGKSPNENWNGVIECKNSRDKKLNMWVMEMKLPWEQFSISNPNGKDIGLLISRNWKRPSQQNPWSATKIPFSYVTKYPLLQLRKNVPAVRVKQLGNLFERKVDMLCEIYNPSSAPIKCDVKVSTTHTDMPASSKSYLLNIPGRSSKKIIYTANSGKIHNDAGHTLKVECKANGKNVFSREITWQLPVDYAKRWRLSGESATDFFFSYYPSLNLIGFKLNGKLSETKLKFIVSNLAGKKIATKTFNVNTNEITDKFTIPSLTDGKYQLICNIVKNGKTIKTLKRNFLRHKFDWENNKIGITSKVYPPFKPLKVSGRKVSMVLRDYEINDFGLLNSIKAKGKELLAQPMAYVIDGKWLKSQGDFSQKSADKVVFKSEDRAAEFMLKTTSSIEYDGCIKIETTLVPLKKNATVRKLYLDIPLKSNDIRLMHIIKSDTIRTNPAIKVPAGQGVVWKSIDNGNGYMLGNMHPYIWLGHMARGIAWFADNDKNWNIDDKRSVQELIRKDGVLTLRIKLVDVPLKLIAPRKIIFGIQASPTKPMPRDWRRPKQLIPAHGGSNPYWGIAPAYAGKYPVGNDWEIVEEMLKTRNTGKVDPKMLDAWIKKKYSKLSPKVQKYYRNHIRGGFYGMLAKQRQQPKMLYFEEHCQDRTSPEWVIFQDEWGLKPFTGRSWYTKIDDMNRIHGAGERIAPSRSYQDFAIWNVAKWNRHGIGIYCDNTFPRNNYDMNVSNAYIRKDGHVQPSAGIWDMRDYHKRMWLTLQQIQPETKYPLKKSLHITNGMLIPIVGWSDILLDLEWTWKGGLVAFPRELLEIESTGRQVGCYPHIHYFIVGVRNMFPNGYKKSFDPRMARAEWGMRTLYGILRYPKLGVDFDRWNKIIYALGYGTEKCKVSNYWDDNYPVKISPDSIKSLLLENNGKYMLVVQGWNEKTVSVDIAINNKQIIKAVNAENNKDLTVENGKVKIKLKRYGMRIIKLELKKWKILSY